MIALFLAVGIAALWLLSLALLWRGDVYSRVHLVSAAGVFGGACVVLPIVATEGLTQSSFKALFCYGLLLFYGPVLSHAMGRAVRLREESRP